MGRSSGEGGGGAGENIRVERANADEGARTNGGQGSSPTI